MNRCINVKQIFSRKNTEGEYVFVFNGFSHPDIVEFAKSHAKCKIDISDDFVLYDQCLRIKECSMAMFVMLRFVDPYFITH